MLNSFTHLLCSKYAGIIDWSLYILVTSWFLLTTLRQPPDGTSAFDTRNFHATILTNLSGNFYFQRLPRIWNALPIINCDLQ